MNQRELEKNLLKAAKDDLTPEQQEQVVQCEDEIRAVIGKYNEDVNQLAVAQVILEMTDLVEARIREK